MVCLRHGSGQLESGTASERRLAHNLPEDGHVRRDLRATVGAPSPSLAARLAGAAGLIALCSLLSACKSDRVVGPPGPPAQLAFLTRPSSATAGAVISPAVQVAVRDAQGRTATGFVGGVTVAIGTNPASGTLSGTTTLDATAGVATFPTLSIDKSGIGYTLSATAAGLTGATSGPFAINAGSPAQLAFTVQPTNAPVGATIAPAVRVTAQDALGNTVAGYTGSVTLTITAGTGPSGATLAGATTVTAVAGVATFSLLSIDKTGTESGGTGYTLSATATALTGATSDPFDILTGPASQLAFTIQPSPITAGAHIAPPVQVTVRDAFGNTVSDFIGNVTVAIGTNPAGGTLSGTKTVAVAGGIATFSTLSIDRVGSGYTLAGTTSGLAGATSAPFAVTPGAATRVVFTVQPGATTAGAAVTPAVQVTVRDALGNTATGFAGNVTVAIGTNPAGGTLSGSRTVAANAGVATFAGLSIDNAGNGYTLSVTATGLAGDTSAAFNVVPSTPAQLTFAVQPTTTTAGVTITPAVQVTARDAAGQVATSFTGNVTLAITAGTGSTGAVLAGTATVPAVNGVASFTDLRIDQSGRDYRLTATGGGLAAATSALFDIPAGAAIQLVFTVQPSTATVRATIAPQVEVTARDGLGNTAEGFTGSVAVAITAGTGTSGAVLSGTTTVQAVAGVAAFFTLSIDRGGTGYTLSATAVGPTGAVSDPFDITATAATALVFTAQPTNTTAGATITPAVQVTARNALGQTETSFTGNVTLTITAGTGAGGATLSGTRTVAAVAGLATFSTLSIDRSGTGYRLSATAAGLAGVTSAAFTVNAGPPSRLAFTVQPASTTAGASIAPAVQVTVRDALGNSVTTFTGTVTVALGTNPAGGTLSGTKAVAAVAGIATFAGLSIDKAASGYALSATATGLTGATSAAFSITTGVATQLAFTVQPSSAPAGASMAPSVQVTVRDASGNTVSGFTGNVTVAIGTNPGGGALSGTKTVAAAGGVAAFSTLSIDKSGTGYTLVATAGALPAVTSAPFGIAPGTATQLVFSVPPSTATAGANLRPTVQVTARDALGNAATGFAGNVTVAIGTNPAGGTLSGTRTFAGIDGVATFPGLSIDSVGSGYTLSATAAGVAGVASAAFDIVPSTATQLFFTVQPTDTVHAVTAGSVITPAAQVTARDASGQTATSFTGSVTLTITPGTGTGGATLLGTTTAQAVAGVANFADLRINVAGTSYKLSATGGGLPAVTSAFFNVTAGVASQLAFTVQPSTATARATIAPQVEVTARDAQGNIADAFAGDVAVAITAGTGTSGATLSGTTAVRAEAGVAGFSTLSIGQSGTGYTLSATATGLTGAASAPFDVASARATALVYTTQPTSTTAGATITPAVRVEARNASGLTETSFTGNVTLTITAGTGTSIAVLSGTRTVAAVAGVATFTTLSVDRSGTGYRLSAAAAGLAGATSAAFTVKVGSPSQLTFTAQPGSTEAGATIAPQVQATVRDALGNPVRTFTGNVTLAIGTNPGTGTLSGTRTVAAVAGVASFNDLSIDRVGVGYRLQVTASGLNAATSDAFAVTAGTATLIVFSVQPSTAAAGAAIKPNVRLAAFDALGNPATGFTGAVTLAITVGTGTSGATLSGTTTVAADNGVAQFSDLKIGLPGTAYRLSATATGLAGVTSTVFDIN